MEKPRTIDSRYMVEPSLDLAKMYENLSLTHGKKGKTFLMQDFKTQKSDTMHFSNTKIFQILLIF